MKLNLELLRKEALQVWPLAVLGFVVSSWFAMADASHSFSPLQPFSTMHSIRPDGGLNIPIIHTGHFGLIALGSGFVLGLWQTFSENVRGTWAFLLHRPLSRRWLIGHKLITGCVLLLLMTGLPLAALFWWALSPGHHVAPLEWRMTSDLRALWFAGTVPYFAGILCGIREARWYGSRFLPVGIAGVVISIIASTGTLFGWATVLTLFIDVLLVAAILHEGDERSFS